MNEIIVSKNLVTQSSLLPLWEIWWKIDWGKIIRNNRLPYDDYINWNNVVNDRWDFDSNLFIESRLYQKEVRDNYLSELNGNIKYLNHISNESSAWIYLKFKIKDIINEFKKMFFLWKNSEVYDMDFYKELLNISNIFNENQLGTDETIKNYFTNVIDLINKWLKWEDEKWSQYLNNIKKEQNISIDWFNLWNGFLNVDKVINLLKWKATWSNDTLILVFYKFKLTNEDLKKLQTWALEALDIHFSNLDTIKVFEIIEFILPNIFNGFDVSSINFPEIFNPEYLKEIIIYDLTLSKFKEQVNSKDWSDEVKENIITQFVKYWTDIEWNIWFGQWSEQLFYWNNILWTINEMNYKSYLKEDLWYRNKPLPSILKNIDYYVNESRNELLKNI